MGAPGMPRAGMRKHVRSQTSIPSGRRWTAAEAGRVLAELDASGEKLSAFALRHDLDPQRLHAWRRRLAASVVPAFVELNEVTAQEPLRGRSGWAVEIVASRGVLLRFDRDSSPEYIASIVRAIGDAESC